LDVMELQSDSSRENAEFESDRESESSSSGSDSLSMVSELGVEPFAKELEWTEEDLATVHQPPVPMLTTIQGTGPSGHLPIEWETPTGVFAETAAPCRPPWNVFVATSTYTARRKLWKSRV